MEGHITHTTLLVLNHENAETISRNAESEEGIFNHLKQNQRKKHKYN